MNRRALVGIWIVVGVGIAGLTLLVASRWRLRSVDDRPMNNLAATPAAGDSPILSTTFITEQPGVAEVSTFAADASGSGTRGGYGSNAGESSHGSAHPYRVDTGKSYPGGNVGLTPFGSSGGSGGGRYASGGSPRGSSGWTGYSPHPSRSSLVPPASSSNTTTDRKLAELEARAAALEQTIERLLPLVSR